jgi:hypothetical protein
MVNEIFSRNDHSKLPSQGKAFSKRASERGKIKHRRCLQVKENFFFSPGSPTSNLGTERQDLSARAFLGFLLKGVALPSMMNSMYLSKTCFGGLQ